MLLQGHTCTCTCMLKQVLTSEVTTDTMYTCVRTCAQMMATDLIYVKPSSFFTGIYLYNLVAVVTKRFLRLLYLGMGRTSQNMLYKEEQNTWCHFPVGPVLAVTSLTNVVQHVMSTAVSAGMKLSHEVGQEAHTHTHTTSSQAGVNPCTIIYAVRPSTQGRVLLFKSTG